MRKYGAVQFAFLPSVSPWRLAIRDPLITKKNNIKMARAPFPGSLTFNFRYIQYIDHASKSQISVIDKFSDIIANNRRCPVGDNAFMS